MLRTTLTLIVLGILHLSGASAQCGITTHPASQNVSVGDVVNLRCLTESETGSDGFITDWLFERDGASTRVDRNRYELLNDGTLTISSFDPSYAGLYRCVVDNRCVSKPGKLLYFNTQGTFQTHPQDFVAYEGTGTAAFNCTYDESEYSIPPTIFWQLNDDTVLSQDNPAIVVFSYRYTSFLQIHQPTSAMNMASIRCLARSESGADVLSEVATLNIISGVPPSDGQPSFSTEPIRLMYLNKGDTVIAGCSSDKAVDSIPIAWAFENNTEFYYTSFNLLVFDIPVSLYGHTNLLVNSAEYDYHGVTYLCQLLWNSGGRFFSAPVTFFVYDNPAISVPPDNVVTRETGEQVAFSIEVNKNTPAMVKWFFNGASLSSNGRVEIANENNEDFAINKVWTQDLDASFHINNITCYDIGFYQVEISNPAETVLLTYELIVENCVPIMVPGVTVDDNTININGSNVTLTLSWGEPFNNLDPIMNYTVSCSGDVTCPPNFTTTDNTTRNYTITNLTPMTNYTFSVVATNSIGSGEAGVVMITTPSGVQARALQGNDDDDDSFPWWIILIIILLILILLLLLLLCCWCWRRRYVVYEAEKLETKYHKDYQIMRRGDATL